MAKLTLHYCIIRTIEGHYGEANTALVKLLSKHFKIPKTSITIVSGAKSRIKTIEL